MAAAPRPASRPVAHAQRNAKIAAIVPAAPAPITTTRGIALPAGVPVTAGLRRLIETDVGGAPGCGQFSGIYARLSGEIRPRGHGLVHLLEDTSGCADCEPVSHRQEQFNI